MKILSLPSRRDSCHPFTYFAPSTPYITIGQTDGPTQVATYQTIIPGVGLLVSVRQGNYPRSCTCYRGTIRIFSTRNTRQTLARRKIKRGGGKSVYGWLLSIVGSSTNHSVLCVARGNNNLHAHYTTYRTFLHHSPSHDRGSPISNS